VFGFGQCGRREAVDDGGGVAAMSEFFFTYLWPLIIILAESILMLVILLVAIAYILYARACFCWHRWSPACSRLPPGR
jgi:peptidoglycan/LPS O-acetylase OafA/YrhL